MRVTFVAYDDTPPLGGQGVVLEGMRTVLERRGVRVHTIAGRGERAIPFPAVLHRAPLDLSLHLNRRPSLLLTAPADVVHAHGGPGGVILLRRLDVPLVYTAHHTYTQAHSRWSPYRLPAPLEARSYRNAAMVLAVSESTARAVRAMGVSRSRLDVLPPGVSVPGVPVAEREPGRLLFVGRLRADKGVLDAVTVMESLLHDGIASSAAVVGDGPMAGEVRARASRVRGLEYLGAVPADAAQREYARAAVLLMPSRYEGLGLAALEAQASGTPVVGYDVDGLRHAVTAGGLLVQAGDVGALREQAAALLRDAPRRAELGARGRELVIAEHSWERVGDRLLQVYRHVSGAGM